MMWQPIETAPRDGTVVLVWCPEAVFLDDRAYEWPKNASLHVFPAIWRDAPGAFGAGWYAPWQDIYFVPWDDPSPDITGVQVEPTHWMPLPAPPSDEPVELVPGVDFP
jgi:hypothetical protein